jgi:PAS domain S-box-containing protein
MYMPIQQMTNEALGLNIFIVLNLLIGLVFITIPVVLIYFLYQRRHETPFKNLIIVLIATFIAISLYFFGRIFLQETLLLIILSSIAILSIVIVLLLIRSHREAIQLPDPRSLENLIHEKTQELAGTHRQLSTAIAQKQKAEEEIKFLFNFQKAVQLSSIVSMADKKGLITYVNENFEKISGYTRDELLGQNHRIINSGHHEKSFWINMWKTIASGQIWREEVKNKAKDGSYYWVDTFIIPFVDDDGKITQFLSIRNDISRRKKIENQLKLLNDELERKVLEKTQDLQVINDELVKLNFLMESLQKHVNIGVWEVDLDDWQTYWSDEIFAIYESPKKEAVPFEETMDFYHPEDREKIKKAMGAAINEGASWDMEARLITFEKNEIWVRTTGVPILDNGKTIRLKGLFQNIDRQKRNEERLRNSQAIINLAIEAGEIGVFTWNLEQGKLVWNKYMHEHFGLPPEKFTGTIQDFMDRVHPEDVAKVEASIEGDFDNKSKYIIDYRVVLDNGQINYMEATGVLSRNPEGKAVEMTGICLNVTEKKEFENLLREKEERFRLAFEHSPTGLALQSLDGKWLKVNKALCDIIGYTEEELLKTTFQDITHPDDLKNDSVHLEKLINGEVESYHLEKRYIHKKGEIVWIQINKSMVRNEKGDPLYFISQMYNITRRKLAEMEIKKMNDILEAHTEKLESANRELESFTYSVSHDLRAPLRSINGYAQVLKEDYSPSLDKEGNEVIDIVIRNAQRMGQLIDDLLEFSRIGRKDVAKGIVNMPSLVEGIANEMIEQEKDRVIDLKILPLEKVKADMQMIRQVWINLISNAIKYTRNKEVASIEIGCKNHEDEVCYYIKDNGVGFNMNYVDKLFEVFQRLHRNDEFEGTGVGLALVRRIINRHGGKIWVEAKENQGATFYFTLPKG